MKQRTSRQVWDIQPHRLVMLNSFISACLLFDNSVRDLCIGVFLQSLHSSFSVSASNVFLGLQWNVTFLYPHLSNPEN